ncbi:hypothetical protein Cri9333_2796 [Crinalium epipsammum PCC 9333]|uniref:Uncharacterized protein n=1 Tax=Crinalium epipsammum PCC 9333 TaxID=1173022 RepID=K9W1M8_9CYAN|nr:tetratricopeptide repeat protein [Crinalium epipsammum]AFZ13642.1 hypothetical protein Cri9333_2796 [Crinalium epipsammum PCC 9333]
MLEQVAEAFKRKQYQTVSKLLKQLIKQEPQNPWVQFYVGRLYEETGKLESAENVYRQLLKDTTHPKIIPQARQGLQRIADILKQQRQQAIADATATPESAEIGVMILESINPEFKKVAAQKLAGVMEIDPYTARLHLPTRGWRLYKIGRIGELQFLTQQLQPAAIPSFSASLTDIEKINILQVNYFKSNLSQVTVVCKNDQSHLGSITFDWSEVKQRVEGLLPIFEEVVDFDVKRKLQRKTKILDYVQCCDLHLPERGSILRLCDFQYQFQHSISLSQKQADIQAVTKTTTRNKWNNLINFLNHQLPQTSIWSDFTIFGETAVNQTELLGRIKPHIELSRNIDTLWDQAFHLYSGLIFLRSMR